MFLPAQKPPQQNHINQLLSTAATGAGVVGDVDALLTPIEMTPQQRPEHKTERNLWREDEMLQMLKFMLQANALEMLNDKSVKSERVFRNIEKQMFQCGYRKKSYMQIWTKWKFLKSTYMTSRRAGIIPRMIPPTIYRVLDTILNGATSAVGSGKANSTAGSSLDGYNSDNGRLVISHVESTGCSVGGDSVYTNGFVSGTGGGKKQNSSILATGDSSGHEADDDVDFGMAHPIFGFRLGMVKPEPADTGYETAPQQMSSGDCTVQDSLEDSNDNYNAAATALNSTNVFLKPDIKKEAAEAEQSNSRQSVQEESSATSIIATSTPKTAQMPSAAVPHEASSSHMQPLRCAPFAKTPQQEQQNMPRPRQYREQQQRQHLSRSSPPQQQQHQQQQAHRHFTRQSHLQHNMQHHSSKARPLQRFLLPKIMQKVYPGDRSIRLPPDITVHQTQPSAIPAAATRFKQMCGRKPNCDMSPHHTETVLPDMDAEEVSRQKYKPQAFANYTDVGAVSASGSYAAALPTSQRPTNGFSSSFAAESLIHRRKRRLQLPPYIEPRPAKMMKSYAKLKPCGRYAQHQQYGNDPVEVIDDDDATIDADPIADRSEPRQGVWSKNSTDNYLAKAFSDLGKSLRNAQRELLDEFFEKQMQLAREERAFQAEQDRILLKAFEEQTQVIVKSAQMLLGIDLPLMKEQDKTESSSMANKKVDVLDDTSRKIDEIKETKEAEREIEEEAADVYGNYDQENDEIYADDEREFDENQESSNDTHDGNNVCDDDDDDGEDADNEPPGEKAFDAKADPIELFTSELVED